MSLAFWALAVPVAVAAVPRFDINLDLPPELRYKEVSEHYAEEILAMVQQFLYCLVPGFGYLKLVGRTGGIFCIGPSVFLVFLSFFCLVTGLGLLALFQWT